MDWTKIDPALASAIEDIEHSADELVRVLVRVNRAPTMTEAAAAGIDLGADSDRPVFTATAPLVAVERLTEEPWVRSLTLSRILHPRPASPT
jgi:hypothetical protein